MSEVRELQARLRKVRADMKAAGVRRTSMMNGGHSMESMRFNEECFRLETAIKAAKRATPANPRAGLADIGTAGEPIPFPSRGLLGYRHEGWWVMRNPSIAPDAAFGGWLRITDPASLEKLDREGEK